MLFAANVQQVADFSLIARRVAETALIPGILVMDREATARSAQELSVPAPDLVSRYLGPAEGEMPSPTTPPSGCRFRTRCPSAHDRCEKQTPELKKIGPQHQVACHLKFSPQP